VPELPLVLELPLVPTPVLVAGRQAGVIRSVAQSP